MTTIAATTSTSFTTRRLLAAGIVAGPFYCVLVAAQALTRDGFDIRKHAASMLAVGPVTMSWHGGLHFAAGGIGFLCFVVTCFILARRFAREGERGWTAYSIITGVCFLAAFAGIASGSAGGPVLAFYAAVALSWTWIALVLRKFQQPA